MFGRRGRHRAMVATGDDAVTRAAGWLRSDRARLRTAFHHLLESDQVFLKLPCRIFGDDPPGQVRADTDAGDDTHIGRLTVVNRDEIDRPAAVNVTAGRTPSDEFIFDFVDDFSVPFDTHSVESVRAPVRT